MSTSPEKVEEIRRRYAEGGITQRALAAEYGLAQQSISYILGACAYKRRADAERYKEYRAWLDEEKLTRGCVDCGYNEHPAALHFDHLDHLTKDFTLAHGASRSRDRVLDEMAKCEVRCANCHAVRTATQAGVNLGRPVVVKVNICS